MLPLRQNLGKCRPEREEVFWAKQTRDIMVREIMAEIAASEELE